MNASMFPYVWISTPLNTSHRILRKEMHSSVLESIIAKQGFICNNYLTPFLLQVSEIAVPLHPVISFSVINYVVSMRCPTRVAQLIFFCTHPSAHSERFSSGALRYHYILQLHSHPSGNLQFILCTVVSGNDHCAHFEDIQLSRFLRPKALWAPAAGRTALWLSCPQQRAGACGCRIRRMRCLQRIFLEICQTLEHMIAVLAAYIND